MNLDDLIKFDDVSLSFYDKKRELLVLNDISFSLTNEKIHALIGPSGCGKSTILNLIAGIIKPSKGKVLCPKSIGYMFQRDNLLEWLTILDNVLIGLKIKGLKTKENVNYAKSLLEKYGLKDFIKSYPCELSGGMRQRVALIRALVLKPDVLLLDEPFSALDSGTRVKVSSDIYEIIKDFKITTILVTHDISEAISLADEIIVLSHRPAKIKEIITISINDLIPIKRRETLVFKDYFKKVFTLVNE